MPPLQKDFSIIVDQTPHLGQPVIRDPVGMREFHRLEPKLRPALARLDVDVRRLVPFVAEEEEPEPADAEDCGHAPSLSASFRGGGRNRTAG